MPDDGPPSKKFKYTLQHKSKYQWYSDQYFDMSDGGD